MASRHAIEVDALEAVRRDAERQGGEPPETDRGALQAMRSRVLHQRSSRASPPSVGDRRMVMYARTADGRAPAAGRGGMELAR